MHAAVPLAKVNNRSSAPGRPLAGALIMACSMFMHEGRARASASASLRGTSCSCGAKALCRRRGRESDSPMAKVGYESVVLIKAFQKGTVG